MLKGLRHDVVANTVVRSKHREEALTGVPGGAGPLGTSSRTFGKNTQGDILQTLTGGTEQEVRFFCKDIYAHDPVAGSIVDLISNIPFGPYSLSGIPSADNLRIFQSSCDKLRIDSLFRAATVDYMVCGAFLGILRWDSSKRVFDAVLPQNLDNAEITPLPLFGHTPLIELKSSTELQALQRFKDDPRVSKILQSLPDSLRSLGGSGRVVLNTESTLYLPRLTYASQFLGVSILRRIVPLYLLEKALMRGTIELAHRRQRAILHLVMGDEMWLPTNEQLKEGADQFQVADSDPVGAVIATRPGIQIQEVQQGGEFWRWTDVMETLNAQKFRALGVSEGFLNGEANVEGVETGMSVFIQQTRSYRDYATRVMMTEKIFPYISVANEMTKGGDRVYGNMERNADGNFSVYCDTSQPNSLEHNNLDMSDYHIPVMTWHNQLRPEGSATYMQSLRELQAMGIPVPLRMLAAASGVSLHEILYGIPEDLQVRKQIGEYFEKIQEVTPEGMTQEQAASLKEAASKFSKELTLNSPKGLANRDFGELSERMNPNVINGRRYVSTSRGRKDREEKADRIAAEAAANLAYKLNRQPDEASVSTKVSPI